MADHMEKVPVVKIETLEENTSAVVQNEETNGNGQLKQPYSSTPRNKSPVTIQEWVDSLPTTVIEPQKDDFDHVDIFSTYTSLEADNLTLGAEAGYLSRITTIPIVTVTTESNVVHAPSEADSHTSSFDSKLLNARKPDPEDILLGLGFGGGVDSTNYGEYGRVPQRFLQPSQLKGVSVEDYIRHQQELIYMYESGLWGYRGLTGPPHANPSIIVAKIMEKLREHEREVLSPKVSPRVIVSSATNNSLQIVENNEKPIPNRFSKAAHNILTKIRCTPGSVLTPDNRKWLDSQGGDKSPEMSRRLIIGQQSFVFTRDGALIESPPSSVVNGSENYSGMANKKDSVEQICSVKNKSSIQSDDESQIMFRVGSSSTMSTDVQQLDINKNKPDTMHSDSGKIYDKEYSPERDLEDLLSIVEPCQDVSKASSEVDSGAASESADTSCTQNIIAFTDCEIMNSENITLVPSKILLKQYEDLCNLRARLNVLGCPFNIVPEEQFISLSVEQRCALQCKILRLALRVYLNQLTDDEVHQELKSCLGKEVQHVADLLDSNSDVDKLAIIVRQMTVLLHHQTHLNTQLAELTARAQNPLACHDMCEIILQRVRGLEQLVEQNASDLAVMKAQLLNKK
ncbi:uncharacterized protein LOC126841531 isoform X2 [Adelges cooleyi]|uniref:uncharacterized protein LOC126841531 isoform X2 n=1 Tax=Adelges cooleyi TaxID=133065 RepID=UPI00217FD2DC|nr:uncharacterized protein LOC126841531 isoform X2 [Adelges cooleyi]